MKSQVAIYKIVDDSNLNELEKLLIASHYREQPLQPYDKTKYEIKIFYTDKDGFPEWKNFLRKLVTSSADLIKSNISRNESFVLTLKKISNNNCYAITGGAGSFKIKDYIDSDFGLDIFSRLVNKSEDILKSTREKGVTGSVLGITKHFRRNSSLFDIDSFGKIYQELKAEIDNNLLINHFGFTQEELSKDSVCIAKNSFKISKKITFDQVYNIIDGCEYIMNNFQATTLNNFEKVDKKDKALVEELKNILYEQLWKRYRREDESFDFDLCHQSYEDYLMACSYSIMAQKTSFLINNIELNTIDKLFEELKISNILFKDKKSFLSFAKSLIINSFDENKEVKTSGGLFEHIMGDVLYNNNRYFLIDKSWYLVKAEFQNELNKICNHIIQKNSLPEKYNLNKWGDDILDEHFFNLSHIGENTLVVHKITLKNIELCDIIKWDDEKVYLYHVKKGFDNSMRELCSQIIVSANLLQNLSFNSKLNDYLITFYNTLANKVSSNNEYDKKIGNQTKSLTLDELKSIFSNNKTYVFVLAILDEAKADRAFSKGVESFNSNIAKFSLQDLSKSMKTTDFEFKISQILKN